MGPKISIPIACIVFTACAAFLVLDERGAPAPIPPTRAVCLEVHSAETAALVDAAASQRSDRLVASSALANASREPVVLANQGPSEPTTVRVRAVDPDGVGVEGATVRLSPYRMHEPVLAEATTDAEGRAVLVPSRSLGTATAEGAGPRGLLRWSAPTLAGGSRDYDDLSDEVDLPLFWTATLVGTVRDAETGLATEGAVVECCGARTTSGTDGGYRLDGVLLGFDLALSTRLAGYLAQDLMIVVPVRGEHAVDVALERASVLRVRVVDRETGAPIQGAELAESESGPVITACDLNGFADLDTAVGARMSVVARAPEHVPVFWISEVRDVPNPSEGPAATFPLARASWAKGRVLTPGQAPIAGAWVRGTCEEHRLRVAFSEELRKELGLYGMSGDRVRAQYVQTDETGSFRVRLPTCGDPVAITASQEGRPDATAGPFEPPPPGGTLYTDLVVREGGSVRGRVTRGGEPSGGEVVAHAPDGATLARTFCGDDGRYELSAVPPGTIRLELRSFPFEKVLVSAEIVVEPNVVTERDLEWSANGAEIRGRVLARDGTPRAGVNVSASASDPTAITRHAWARTARDGGFGLAVDSGISYKVTATHGPATDLREGVRAGDAPLELVLPETGTVVLRLVDASTGAAIGSLTGNTDRHVAWATSGDAVYRSGEESLDVGGRLAFDVEAGSVDVLVHLAANGYERALVRGVAVPVDGESAEVVVRLEPGAEARLSFEDDADPLSDHVVFALAEEQLALVEGPFPDQRIYGTVRINGICVRLADPLLLNQHLAVKPGGVYVLRGLVRGRYRLRAFPDDVVFEPDAFNVPEVGGAPIELRWRVH